MPGAPKRLRCEYLENPIGIDGLPPRLSWWLDDERPAEIQTAYHILASVRPDQLDADIGDLWDTGRVESSATGQIVYAGKALTSRQRVWWKVRSFDSDGIGTPWSRIAFFEVGLIEQDDWRARWIAAPLMGGKRTPVQVPALRRSFEVPKAVQSARLYITALGVYDVEINGVRAIDVELAPGWTDFAKRARYQVYDVTRFLRQGENVVGVLLGDGWYCGALGPSDRQQYGDKPALLAQLEITLEDGTPLRFGTDELWKWQRSQVLYSDVMHGESVDARQRLGAWSAPGYDLTGWAPVDVLPRKELRLNATMHPAIRVVDRLDAVAEPRRRMGEQGQLRLIFDMGQNVVGRVRLQLRAARGTLVEVRYAERLDDRGELSVANGSRAGAADLYTCAGDADGEVFEPRFALHAFQFIEVCGRLNAADVESVTAIVLGSGLTQIGEFQCDHPLLNRLQNNIQWSQRGSYVDLPADADRLGRTGDAQIFVRSAAFNMDVAAFFGKWLVDLTDAQAADGTVPPVAPVPPALTSQHRDGGPAWSDAIVICPWTMYRCCGDKRILERHFGAMKAFVDNIESRYPSLIRADASVEHWQGYGDWLAFEEASAGDRRHGNTPKDLIGTAFFCYSAKLLARISGVLGNVSDLEHYEALAQGVRAAFRRRFVTADGRLVGETQTAYVLALYFGLLDRDEVEQAMLALVRDIEGRGMQLSTGIVGSTYLLHVLTNNGRLDLAYQLLLKTTPPSWLYPVTQGATTVWERWDGGSGSAGLSSAESGVDPNGFNQCAFGAVGEWLYGTLAGLDLDPDLAPARNAYRRARIQPRPPRAEDFPNGLPIRYASATLDSVHGRYEVSWEITGGRFVLHVRIPANCSAKVILPDGATHEVVAGRHQFAVAVDVLADDGIPLLSEITELAV
jgi:alpha-L-rhamnosidase